MSPIIDTNLENLSDLAEFLSDEVAEQTIDNQLTPRGRACQEALVTAGVLIGKLEAVRSAKLDDSKQLQFAACEACE